MDMELGTEGENTSSWESIVTWPGLGSRVTKCITHYGRTCRPGAPHLHAVPSSSSSSSSSCLQWRRAYVCMYCSVLYCTCRWASFCCLKKRREQDEFASHAAGMEYDETVLTCVFDVGITSHKVFFQRDWLTFPRRFEFGLVRVCECV